MNEIIDMGGYAMFVWSSYGIFFCSLIVFFLINLFKLRKQEKVLNKINIKSE
jgi:heme exporter protein CcmD